MYIFELRLDTVLTKFQNVLHNTHDIRIECVHARRTNAFASHCISSDPFLPIQTVVRYSCVNPAASFEFLHRDLAFISREIRRPLMF